MSRISWDDYFINITYTVYVGRDGVPFARPSMEFYGYKDGIKRFKSINELQPRDTIRQPEKVLLFHSYCSDNNSKCTNENPCDECLRMSNVLEIPAGTEIVNHGNLLWENT